MKKINNRDEANFYYKKVNIAINSYIKDYKIEPVEIKSWIISNLDRFIKKYDLLDIDNIKQIIIDVLDHKVNSFKDKKKNKINEMKHNKVIKFKNFIAINESFLETSDSGIEHEKVLADFFNTSLGHIEEVDKENHIYNVVDFGKTSMVVIFSEEEIEKIGKNIIKSLVDEISNKNLIVSEVQGIKLGSEISIEVESLVDKSKLENICTKEIDSEVVVDLITNKMSSDLVFVHKMRSIKFIDEYEKHFIWKME
jgi:hypothetical protein